MAVGDLLQISFASVLVRFGGVDQGIETALHSKDEDTDHGQEQRSTDHVVDAARDVLEHDDGAENNRDRCDQRHVPGLLSTVAIVRGARLDLSRCHRRSDEHIMITEQIDRQET